MVDCPDNQVIECRQLDSQSLRNMSNVHPDLVKVVIYAREHSPVEFVVTNGQRTKAQQRRNVSKGVSRTMDPKHLKQKDGYSHAVDLVPKKKGRLSWNWELMYPLAEAMREGAEHYNVQIVWGGFWDILNNTKKPVKSIVHEYKESILAKGLRAFLDGPHFEVKFLEE